MGLVQDEASGGGLELGRLEELRGLLLGEPVVPTAHAFSSVRQALRRFMQCNHRSVESPVVNLSGVQFVPYISGGTTTSLPAEPLDMPLRKKTNWFMWRRSPFDPATAGQGRPAEERPGIDVVLPYWMGKHHGAF